MLSVERGLLYINIDMLASLVWQLCCDNATNGTIVRATLTLRGMLQFHVGKYSAAFSVERLPIILLWLFNNLLYAMIN